MPLHYSVPKAPDARRTRVLAYCPVHPDQKVAHWSTYDGTTTTMWINGASSQEYVGEWTPTEDERRTAEAGIALPVAEAPTGDTAHFRYHLRCTKPSCSYRGVYRSRQFDPMQALAILKWRAGETAYDLGDVDSFLKRIKS